MRLDDATLAAIHGEDSATFSLDDFDAFDELMARGWCFNPDSSLHKRDGVAVDGRAPTKAVPGQLVFVHLALFRWDGGSGGLTRLASSATPGSTRSSVCFRVAHESWLGDGGDAGATTYKWMTSSAGGDAVSYTHLTLPTIYSV